METFIEGQPLKRELEGSLKTQIHEVYKTKHRRKKNRTFDKLKDFWLKSRVQSWLPNYKPEQTVTLSVCLPA